MTAHLKRAHGKAVCRGTDLIYNCVQVPRLLRVLQRPHLDLEGRIAQRGEVRHLRRYGLSGLPGLRMGRIRTLSLQVYDVGLDFRVPLFTHQW